MFCPSKGSRFKRHLDVLHVFEHGVLIYLIYIRSGARLAYATKKHVLAPRVTSLDVLSGAMLFDTSQWFERSNVCISLYYDVSKAIYSSFICYRSLYQFGLLDLKRVQFRGP